MCTGKTFFYNIMSCCQAGRGVTACDMSRFKELGDTSSPTVKHVKEEEDLFEGDIKLTPKQKAALQSDHATIENWRIAANKWQRDSIPYILDSSLCRLPDK